MIIFLVSIDLFEIIYSSCNFIVSDNIQSQHMPLELFLKLPREDNREVRLPKHTMMSSVKYVWNADQCWNVKNVIDSDLFKQSLCHAIEMIDVNINEALTIF